MARLGDDLAVDHQRKPYRRAPGARLRDGDEMIGSVIMPVRPSVGPGLTNAARTTTCASCRVTCCTVT